MVENAIVLAIVSWQREKAPANYWLFCQSLSFQNWLSTMEDVFVFVFVFVFVLLPISLFPDLTVKYGRQERGRCPLAACLIWSDGSLEGHTGSESSSRNSSWEIQILSQISSQIHKTVTNTAILLRRKHWVGTLDLDFHLGNTNTDRNIHNIYKYRYRYSWCSH